jgi:dihydroorotase
MLSSGRASAYRQLPAGCYNASMTLVEVTYELQSPLTEEQLRHLGQFANTYGLRSFRVDESKKQLSFEYDAARLRETQVAHVLGQAKIAVARRVN